MVNGQISMIGEIKGNSGNIMSYVIYNNFAYGWSSTLNLPQPIMNSDIFPGYRKFV